MAVSVRLLSRWVMLLVAVGLLSASSRALRAQATDTSAAAALARWRVQAPAYVRVSATGARTAGSLQGLAGSDMRLWRGGREWRVPVRAVDTLWVRGRATRAGGVAGAVAGGALLGGFALLFVNACSPGPSEDPCESFGRNAQVVVSAAALGAAGGALAGAVVGTLVPRWHRRHP